MNTSQSKLLSSPTRGFWTWPMRRWRRFQIWRGKRALVLSDELARKAIVQRRKASRLIGQNAQAPCPLLDRLNDPRPPT